MTQASAKMTDATRELMYFGINTLVVMLCGTGAWQLAAGALTASKTGFRAGLYAAIYALLALALFRLVAQLQRWLGRGRAARITGITKWLLALLAPVLCLYYLEQAVIAAYLQRLQRDAAPLVQRLDALSRRHELPTNTALKGIPTGAFLHEVVFAASSGKYTIEGAVPSIDMSGYRVVYSSNTGRWRIAGGEVIAAARDATTVVCTARANTWQCGPPRAAP